MTDGGGTRWARPAADHRRLGPERFADGLMQAVGAALRRPPPARPRSTGPSCGRSRAGAVKIGLLTATRRAAPPACGSASRASARLLPRAGSMSRSSALPTAGARPTGAGWDGPPLRLHDVIGSGRSATRHGSARRSMSGAPRCSTRTASGCIRLSRVGAGAGRAAALPGLPRTACSTPGPSATRPGRNGWSAGGSRTRISRAPPACTRLRRAEARAIRAYGLPIRSASSRTASICRAISGLADRPGRDPPSKIERSSCSWVGCIRRRAWRICSGLEGRARRSRSPATGSS